MLGHPVLMVLARLQFHRGQHSAVPEPSGTRAWTTSRTCSASAICLASVACSEARSRIWATSRWTPAGWARRSAIHRARLVSRRTSGSARFVVPVDGAAIEKYLHSLSDREFRLVSNLSGVHFSRRTAAPPKRNAPCECGSGLKYKHCHGKLAAM